MKHGSARVVKFMAVCFVTRLLHTLARSSSASRHALRIVGALSAGAVIESGDNANGEYIRFADGTQVCWFCATNTYSCTAQTAAGFYDASGSGQKFTYPAEFSGIPSVMFSIGDFSDINGVTYFAGTATAGTKTESPYVVVLAVSSAVNNVVTIRYIAIGKWK